MRRAGVFVVGFGVGLGGGVSGCAAGVGGVDGAGVEEAGQPLVAPGGPMVVSDVGSLRAAVELAEVGQVVEVAAGVYELDRAIVVRDGVRLVGRGGVVVRSRVGECFVVAGEGVRIEGMRFEGGLGEGSLVRVAAGSDAEIEGCVFVGGRSRAGAGLLVTTAEVTVRGSVFEDCVAKASGGGIAIQSGGTGMIEECVFVRCSSGNLGGGVSVVASSSATVVGCSFQGTSAGDGGGVSVFDNSSGRVLMGGFEASEATRRGGGIFAGTGSWLSVWGSEFERCRAALDAGAVKVVRASAGVIEACRFVECEADGFGGGAVQGQLFALVDMKGSVFLGNRSIDHTGGAAAVWRESLLMVSGSAFVGNGAETLYGGGIRIGRTSEGAIVDSLFGWNVAEGGGGIAVGQDGELRGKRTVVDGSVFVGNVADRGADAAIDGGFGQDLLLRGSFFDGGEGGLFALDGFTVEVEGRVEVGGGLIDGCWPSDGGDGWWDDGESGSDESANNDYGEFDVPIEMLRMGWSVDLSRWLGEGGRGAASGSEE